MLNKGKKNLFLYQEMIEEREENEDGEVTFTIDETVEKSMRFSSIPHPVAKYLGFETSFVLYMLIGFWKYNRKQNKSFFRAYNGFMCNSKKAKNEIGIEQKQYLRSIKVLVGLGLIAANKGAGNNFIYTVNLDAVDKFERKVLKNFEDESRG